MASAVPSPPSATGRRSISRGLSAGQPSRQPSAKASAAWAAERVPLNLSGAISTCIEREERSFAKCVGKGGVNRSGVSQRECAWKNGRSRNKLGRLGLNVQFGNQILHGLRR